MVSRLRTLGWGRMYVEKRPQPYAGERWAFDNAAFLWWRQGLPFDEFKYRARLDRAIAVGVPYFGIVPDIVAGGLHSLDFSMKWVDNLPVEWPWYLAVQDGMTQDDITPVIGKFAGLFLGGSDRFKGTAWQWCRLAHQHNKKFHYGRAGTPNKLKHAFRVGADSLDSAFPLWSEERMIKFSRFWSNFHNQQNFEGMA